MYIYIYIYNMYIIDYLSIYIYYYVMYIYISHGWTCAQFPPSLCKEFFRPGILQLMAGAIEACTLQKDAIDVDSLGKGVAHAIKYYVIHIYILYYLYQYIYIKYIPIYIYIYIGNHHVQ